MEREEGGRRRGTWAGAAGRRRGRGRGRRRRRRRDGSRASELVRVLVVEEEDDGGPPGRLGWSWGGRRPHASRVGGRGGAEVGVARDGRGSGEGEGRRYRAKGRVSSYRGGNVSNGAPSRGAP